MNPGEGSHRDAVGRQFGTRAAAYLHSTVHAQGSGLAELRAAVAAREGARVLDLGCGAGHVSHQVAPLAGAVVACDLAPEMLTLVAGRAREQGLANLHPLCAAAEALPLATGSFDLALSRFSAHHWGDPARALAEIRRVLRPGGQSVLVDVISPGPALLDTHLQAVELLRDPSHVRDYSAAEWLRLIAGAGFRATRHTQDRLRLEFAAWVERMATPAPLRAAIRALQDAACREVRDYFEIEPDGSFSVDVMTLWVAG
ncbi:MAG: class I SAM-dependent methyltransferase [Pseudomonadota bacterium]|jgi:ubiquinone/menaquinone biosynthesis C-methylase UbiE